MHALRSTSGLATRGRAEWNSMSHNLPMTDWSSLSHAYGNAVDIPLLLAQLSPDPAAKAWSVLWGLICDQGTVYSASFAALPILAEVAAGWKPADRCQILGLAGAILASSDVSGCREDLLRPVAAVVPQFQALARESIALPNLSQADFIHLMEAVLSFDGDQVWGTRLGQLAGGMFAAACPRCGSADLSLRIWENRRQYRGL